METRIISQEKGMAKVGVTLPGEVLTHALDAVYSRRKDEFFDLPRQGLATVPEGQSLLREAVQNVFSRNLHGCDQGLRSAGGVGAKGGRTESQ